MGGQDFRNEISHRAAQQNLVLVGYTGGLFACLGKNIVTKHQLHTIIIFKNINYLCNYCISITFLNFIIRYNLRFFEDKRAALHVPRVINTSLGFWINYM